MLYSICKHAAHLHVHTYNGVKQFLQFIYEISFAPELLHVLHPLAQQKEDSTKYKRILLFSLTSQTTEIEMVLPH
jgi:hypothetical protein